MAKGGISLSASNNSSTRGVSLPAAKRHGVPIAPAMLLALLAAFLVACLTPLFTRENAVADVLESGEQAAQYPLASCEGTYDDAGNVTAAGLQMAMPSSFSYVPELSDAEKDTWRTKDGLSFIQLRTKDYDALLSSEDAHSEIASSAFGLYYDIMFPKVLEATGGTAVSTELVVNDYGTPVFIGRFYLEDYGDAHADIDVFLVSAPAPDKILFVQFMIMNSAYDASVDVSTLARTITPTETTAQTAAGTAAATTGEGASQSLATSAETTADLDSMIVLGNMTFRYSSSWAISKSDEVAYFYPDGTTSAIMMVMNPAVVTSSLASQDPQDALEDYLVGLKDGIEGIDGCTNVSLGTPSFSASGTVTTATVPLQFTLSGHDYLGFACIAVNSTTLYQFIASSYASQYAKYQPLFQKAWDSATIPGAGPKTTTDLAGIGQKASEQMAFGQAEAEGTAVGEAEAADEEAEAVQEAAEPSRRPVISGGRIAGDEDGSSALGDSEEQSGGRSLSRIQTGTGTGGALSR